MREAASTSQPRQIFLEAICYHILWYRLKTNPSSSQLGANTEVIPICVCCRKWIFCHLPHQCRGTPGSLEVRSAVPTAALDPIKHRTSITPHISCPPDPSLPSQPSFGCPPMIITLHGYLTLKSKLPAQHCMSRQQQIGWCSQDASANHKETPWCAGSDTTAANTHVDL